jgi:hypothetical protein
MACGRLVLGFGIGFVLFWGFGFAAQDVLGQVL